MVEMANLEQLALDTPFDRLARGELAILDPDQRFRTDRMPPEWRALTTSQWRDRAQNPLPRGEDALRTTTVAGWPTEALLRAMISNLCHGAKPEHLIIYGGTGQAAVNWDAFMNARQAISDLQPDETCHMAAGRPYFVYSSYGGRNSPRVIISNSMLVGNWAKYFPQHQTAGMMSYGQMTAGSWIFIGFQGIIQGTYETAAAAAREAESRPRYQSMSLLEQRLMVSEGLGFMSGAQPLAFKMVAGSSGMRNKVALIAEVDEKQIDTCLSRGYLDRKAESIEEAIRMAQEAAYKDEAVSIGVHVNAVDLLEYLVERGLTPHFVTSQSSVHEVLQTNTNSNNTYSSFGYCPQGWTAEQALDKRNHSPQEFVEKSLASVVKQAGLINTLQERGAVVTDYGNFLVGTAMKAGYAEAAKIGGFVPMFVRPLFCEGRGPFRWEVLSNEKSDRDVTDTYMKALLRDDTVASTWLDLASQYIPLEPGLPARVVWAGYGGMDLPGRAAAGILLNTLVARDLVKAPIIIGRDQLDGGSVASPQRETRAMLDGSDAISCYVTNNFAAAIMNGAISVALHDGGGVGVGNSLATNYIALADGTPEAQRKLFWLLMNDTVTGIERHYAAGEPHAVEMVEKHGLFQPGKQFHLDYERLYERTLDFVRKAGVEPLGVSLW